MIELENLQKKCDRELSQPLHVWDCSGEFHLRLRYVLPHSTLRFGRIRVRAIGPCGSLANRLRLTSSVRDRVGAGLSAQPHQPHGFTKLFTMSSTVLVATWEPRPNQTIDNPASRILDGFFFVSLRYKLIRCVPIRCHHLGHEAPKSTPRAGTGAFTASCEDLATRRALGFGK
jgi:hypothetical protein